MQDGAGFRRMDSQFHYSIPDLNKASLLLCSETSLERSEKLLDSSDL